MNTLPTNSEHITCHAVPQEKLIDYARKIFELAKNGKTVEASFNKLAFFVTQEKFKTPEDIANFYLSENLKRDEEYKRSPEYKQRAEEAKKQLRNKQKNATEQEEKLLTITCQYPEKIIDWIEKNRNNIFYMDKEKIQNHFKKMITT
jgi:translation initiation factor 2B subunit (eIF-2B alpha/beta/delta family)